jgi:hypothetical protein
MGNVRTSSDKLRTTFGQQPDLGHVRTGVCKTRPVVRTDPNCLEVPEGAEMPSPHKHPSACLFPADRPAQPLPDTTRH